MPKYECKKCGMKFNKKYNYERHCNRKKSCIGGSKTNKHDDYHCKYCKRGFTRKDSMIRHTNTCKMVKKNKIVKNSKGNNNNNIIKGNNNNIGKNINSTVVDKKKIYINLFFFAKDGTSNISRKDLVEILGSDKNLFETIISNVNLNPNKPQHHNIFYNDTKSSYGEVYEDKKWVKKKIDKILNKLLDAKIEDFHDILNDMGDFLNEKSITKIRDAIENIDYRKKDSRKKLIKYLKPILYNHKDMIIIVIPNKNRLFIRIFRRL